jgi:hypothetical protein
MIDLTNPADVRREAERRQRLRAQGVRTFHKPELSNDEISPTDMSPSRIIDPIEYFLDEKAIEHECDKLAQKAGARVVRFSHPGKTQQTPGIADRLYCFPAKGFALWFEAKTPDGEQRPGQVLFDELVTASGHQYACGGIGDLRAWLIANGVARMEDL